MLKSEYYDLAFAKVKQQIQATLHKLYDTGDKACKLLAWLGRKEVENRWVHKLVDREGNVSQTNEQISAAFAEYYADFYKARSLKDPHHIAQYLHHIQLPRLTAEDALGLEEDITL